MKEKLPKTIQRKGDGFHPLLHYVGCTDIFRSTHGNSYVTAELYVKQKDQFNIITK